MDGAMDPDRGSGNGELDSPVSPHGGLRTLLRAAIASDLHLSDDGAAASVRLAAADLAILPGDLSDDLDVVASVFRGARVDNCPLLYVPGNHELRGEEGCEARLDTLRVLCRETGAELLVRSLFEGTSAVVAGAILWTALREPDGEDAVPRLAPVLHDLGQIRCRDGAPWRAAHWLREHEADMAWLRATFCSEAWRRPGRVRIVVTHHAPSFRSLPPEGWAYSDLDPAFASDCDELVEASGADLWAHGHVHVAADYRIGHTRVLCNPAGYGDAVNMVFDSRLVVEV